MAPKSSKLKEACWKCGSFNPKARGHYKCHVPGTCPGADWSNERKQRALKEGPKQNG